MTDIGGQELNPHKNISNIDFEKITKEIQLVQISPQDKDKDNNLLAPNREPSHLNEYYWRLVRTPTFKHWFGDWQDATDKSPKSQVVDQNEEPLLVYHGTKSDFDQFGEEHIGDNRDSGFFGSGFYFTQHHQLAEKYGERIIKAFLNIRNPQNFNREHRNARFKNQELPFPIELEERVQELFERLKLDDDLKAAQALQTSNGWSVVDTRNGEYEHVWSQAITKALQQIGRDGVIGTNPVSGLEEYMVLSNHQILIIPEKPLEDSLTN